MVVKNAKNMTTARMAAARARKKGFNATPFRTKKGVKVSVTRK